MNDLKRVIIDTNVLIVANERSTQATDECVIAVAKTCEDETPIVNCVDSDWSESAALLAGEDVRVLELCPTCLKACRS